MSTDRVIHCRDYEPRPDSPICQWLRANGVDPSQVPASGTTTVSDGQLTTPQYTDRGTDRFLPPEPDVSLLTVPLISPPEAHGL